MQPTLPFEIWIAHIDILALDAWGVPALALGPQPWQHWHTNGCTPNTPF